MTNVLIQKLSTNSKIPSATSQVIMHYDFGLDLKKKKRAA
jgi:hypothetical protein